MDNPTKSIYLELHAIYPKGTKTVIDAQNWIMGVWYGDDMNWDMDDIMDECGLSPDDIRYFMNADLD